MAGGRRRFPSRSRWRWRSARRRYPLYLYLYQLVVLAGILAGGLYALPFASFGTDNWRESPVAPLALLLPTVGFVLCIAGIVEAKTLSEKHIATTGRQPRRIPSQPHRPTVVPRTVILDLLSRSDRVLVCLAKADQHRITTH
jgi:hypothetical protein